MKKLENWIGLALSIKNKLLIGLAFLFLLNPQDCRATSEVVVRIIESGWFGTAQKADGKHDIAIDHDGDLPVAIKEFAQAALKDRIDGFSFVPENFKHNLSFDSDPEGKFELLLRRSNSQLRLESQLSEFVNFILFLGSYDSYTKIRSDFKVKSITETEAVKSLLILDFESLKSVREFYHQHWVPWCRNNGVIPNEERWGGRGIGETMEVFLLSDYANRRTQLWTYRIQNEWK